MADGKSSSKVNVSPSSPSPPQEKVLAQFQQLRQEQRALAAKISEIEADRNEHNLVIETLKDMEPGRKCFRMVGGVLVERTVQEVLPALRSNAEKMGVMLEGLEQQLQEKGRLLTELREKHNIRFQGDREEGGTSSKEAPTAQGVLVDRD